MTAAAAEVTQTILVGDPSGLPGNCVQAAIASLLGLELDAVPHFASYGPWRDYCFHWLISEAGTWSATSATPSHSV